MYRQNSTLLPRTFGRQTSSFVKEVSCDVNPAIVIALDPDGDDYYLLATTPVKHQTLILHIYSTKHVLCTHSWPFFSPKHKTDLNNRVSFTKFSDKTIQVFVKTLCFDFFHDSNSTFEENIESFGTRHANRNNGSYFNNKYHLYTKLGQNHAE